MKKKITEETNRIDKIYSLYMKTFFYTGIFGFIPFFFLHISALELQSIHFNSLFFYLIFGIIALVILLAMDLIGMNTSYIDRISRLITIILVIFGGFTCILLYIFTKDGWDTDFNQIILYATVLMGVFSFLGWFFVRSDRGLSPKKTKFYLNETNWVMFGIGLVLLFEFFIKGIFLITLSVVFLFYPFAIIIWGKPKVVSLIESRRLVHEYSRTTFYNFIIDTVKAILILLTIMALSYDGTVVLYPNLSPPFETRIWIRNLAFLALWSAVAMAIYTKIQERFYGLSVMIIMFLLAICEYLLVNTFYIHFWWLITPLNGFILAAIFYFIEQKIYLSDNISVMPGSFYVILVIPLITGILLRVDPKIDDILENIKFTLSILGIGYIFGYIREAPKQKSLKASI